MKISAVRIALLLLSALPLAVHAEEPPATFRVTQKVINADLEGFTATVGRMGNTVSWGVGSAFEPPHWRDKIIATEDHPNAVIADDSAISAFDVLREGFLDGADVMVFRIVKGKMTLVRRDKVRDHGHAASGWRGLGGSKLVHPSVTKYEGGFEGWNRPDVDYWFAVTAVDAEGRESEPSNAVHFRRRANPGKQSATNKTVDFKAPSKVANGESPPAPKNLRVRENPENGDAILEWSATGKGDIAGYRIQRSDYDPAMHRGYRLELDSSGPTAEPIRAGDMVIVQKTIRHPSRKELLTNRVFNSHHRKDVQIHGGPDFFPDEEPGLEWSLQAHAADTPVEEPGKTHIKIDLAKKGKQRLEGYAFGDTQQHSRWWPVLNPDKEYVVEAWMRQEGMPDPTVKFAVEGPYKNEMEPIAFKVGSEWRKYSGTFRVPRLLDKPGPVGKMALIFQGPGSLSIDNYRVYEKGTPFLALVPEDRQSLAESGMSALRSHQFIKTGRNTYNMDQLTNAAGLANGTNGNTLPQFLEIVDDLDMRPWLQVEFFMTPEEWQGLVEYMAAPYNPAEDSAKTKPWAAKRHAQGRTAPWTDAFDRIFFEISNETWNRLFAPWTFQAMPDSATGKNLDAGTAYGLFQEWVIDQMQASPYWSKELEDKIEFVIGGWSIQAKENGYGARAVAASPRSRHMTIAAYNGGWDEGEGPATVNDSSFQRILMHAAQTAAVRAAEHAATQAKHRKTGLNYELGVYEAGPGYAMGGLNNQAKMTESQVEEQARAMKSLAAGTATLDTFLTKAQYGFDLNNYFTWSRSHNYWHSHATWYDGGQAYPSWTSLTLFNRFGTGDMLRVESESVPTIDMPEYRRREAASDLPLVSSYAIRDGDRLSVFVISRKLATQGKGENKKDSGFTNVELSLPLRSAKKMTLYRMTGDPRAHNLYEEAVKVESLSIDSRWIGPRLAVGPATGGFSEGMPPASVYLYVIEDAEFMGEFEEAKVELPPVPQMGVVDKLMEVWSVLKDRVRSAAG